MKIKDIRKKSMPVLKRYNIKRAGVFGSAVRNNMKKGSDIDILIELKYTISLFKFARIKNELEDVLHNKVDLVEYKAIKPALREKILNEEVAIL